MNPATARTAALLLRLTALTALLSLGSCASVLTTWHSKAYTPVVELDETWAEAASFSGEMEQAGDLAEAADELYSQGYVLVGYSKFTHTLVPNFQSMYAKMYAKRIGAARALQATPKEDGGIYAYTVTYWAKGREFPFGAYYNDVSDDTALVFPDSLRAAVGPGGRPVYVEAVVAGSPADAAGLRQGELIVALDGESLTGTDDLDARIPLHAEQQVALTVWSSEGLREVTCTLGARCVTTAGIGPEALYYNRPWEFVDYDNFQRYSQAFTDAWHAGWQAHYEAERRAYEDAQFAYLNGELNALRSSHRGSPSMRGSHVRTSAGGSQGLDRDSLRADGAQNWSDFKGEMGWD